MSNSYQTSKINPEAEKLLANKNYVQASELFLRLAKDNPQQVNFYKLQAAEAQLSAGHDEKVRELISSVDVNQLTEQQRNQLYLLFAQLYLNEGNAEQALERLQLVVTSSLITRQKRIYYESKAFAYVLTGQLDDSVRERILLSQILTKQNDKLDNQKAIMSVLALMPIRDLEENTQRQQGSVYQGWAELALISRVNLKGTPKFGRQLSEWEGRYLFHPAHALIASEYFLNIQLAIANVRNIAVFLPESGVYAKHAKAIKEGFMAAYYQQEEALRPNVRFYDTAELAVDLLYEQAVAEGAQLIIGPLNKATLKALLKTETLKIPVLGLNYAEELKNVNLYQFALSPIDEVKQVVEQAKLAGYQNALVLVPDSLLGERIAGYFQTAWELDEERVLSVQKFTLGTTDFSLPVKVMLNVQESEFRYRKLRQVVGAVEYNSRRRQDVDVIFMVANAQEARLINPQFYHNRAGSVAVYGLSRVYSGKQDPRNNVDLNGVGFCTIPWLFDDAYQGDLNKQALSSTWKQFPDKFLSLIAFGIDAYNIVPHLNQLKIMRYEGTTGELSLNNSNRITRKLVCANFKQGLAELLSKEAEMGGQEVGLEVISEN
ncbi:MAG: penicillin-binding protein activator [Methyloprofundus sp.]|nr:penicillin-binding protein activator [Methyloprofundus sp.]